LSKALVTQLYSLCVKGLWLELFFDSYQLPKNVSARLRFVMASELAPGDAI